MTASNNAKWIALAQLVRIGTQLAGLAMLARLLDKSDFGLMAMAWSFINFAYLFRDAGLSSALIQTPDLSGQVRDSAYYASIFLACIVSILLIVLSPVISDLMGAWQLKDILIGLSLSFPIVAFGSTHLALFERASKFRVVAIVESISNIVGLLGVLVLAHLGFGVISMVFQVLIGVACSTTLFRALSDWTPQHGFSLLGARKIWAIGTGVASFNIINYFSRNLDSLIVGKVLGAAPLGVYSMATKLLLFPLQALSFVSNRALYPVLSRSQGVKKDVAKAYISSLDVVTAFSVPIMCGLFSLSREIVQVTLGEKWGAVSDLLLWLAPVGIIQSITATTGVVFLSQGRSRVAVRLALLGALLQLGAVAIGVGWDLKVVVTLYFFANLINLFPCMAQVSKALDISPFEIMVPQLKTLMCGLGMALLMEITKSQVYALVADVPALVFMVLVGSFFYGALFRIFRSTVFYSIFSIRKKRK